ncbi:UNVERIFIED_CONTAM: SWI/SNF complex component SNF12 [Sesamum calycinum]|uniref:SWI/SNF complex component SNF12 n=1 Tax=Sesamum calycinum TaxID=2727403 RepID=A0AAW2STG4_9LAMI
MSANNNNLQKNIGASSPFGSSLPVNPSPQHQMGSGFPGQFQLTAAQAQAIAQAQSKAQAHAQAQVQAAHAQFQAQLQAAQEFLTRLMQGVANLGSPSPSVSGAGSASAKRFPQKPPVRPPSFSPSNTVSPLRTMEASAAARRKKQKLPEKQLQERVAAILPESALYTQLLEFESRVDAALTRKKIDIQEALKTPTFNQKNTFYVFNTFANQVRTIPKKPNAEPPTWTLKIVGRILEEGTDSDQAGMMQKSSSYYPKFSSFFKRVTITLDQKVYPDNHLIIWDSARSPAPHEGFEVLRLIVVQESWPRYGTMSRLENCSVQMIHLLSIVIRNFKSIWGRQDEVHISHTKNYTPPLSSTTHTFRTQIKLSGNSPVGTACYDVLVDVPFPIQRELNALLANTEKSKEIEACDDAICAAIRKIHEHRRRRAFFLGFSQSPVEFINALIDSQNKDLKLVAGEVSRNAEKRAAFRFLQSTCQHKISWKTNVAFGENVFGHYFLGVEDAVIRYLNESHQQMPQGAPESTGILKPGRIMGFLVFFGELLEVDSGRCQ